MIIKKPERPERKPELPTMPIHLLLAQAMNQTLQGVIITDSSGYIIYVNPAFTLSTGYEPEEVLGQNPSMMQSGKHDPEFYREMWSQIAVVGQWQGEIWNRRKNGDVFIEWLNISALKAGDGRVTHYCAIFSDITERKQVELKLKAENRKLEQLSLIDSLTGIGNRRAFDSMLEREWYGGVRSGKPLALLLLDIDYFKQYNDLYGHLQGDEVLRYIASIMQNTLGRSRDFLARYGGEEFAVILPDTDAAGAAAVGQALRNAVSQANLAHQGSPAGSALSISIGCSVVCPSAGENRSTLVQRADEALYTAKQKGRNRVELLV